MKKFNLGTSLNKHIEIVYKCITKKEHALFFRDVKPNDETRMTLYVWWGIIILIHDFYGNLWRQQQPWVSWWKYGWRGWKRITQANRYNLRVTVCSKDLSENTWFPIKFSIYVKIKSNISLEECWKREPRSIQVSSLGFLLVPKVVPVHGIE